MDPITRSTNDLAAEQRSAIEQLLGAQLAENQRIVVQVLDDADTGSAQTPPRSIADYAILADLDAASVELFDNATQRSPSRNQPTL
ncbi:MAG: hypothetical protein AAGA92_14180 [Planctomycetota bacterium]